MLHDPTQPCNIYTERIRILAHEERKKRFLLKKLFRYQGTTFYLAFLQRFFYFPDKELWPEEKEWLKTRAPGPPRE
ncbi:hypothetical protein FBUS_01796 [Fasciolopsis buskii]|uniref:Uncharacterized protein n=1 Tax=Fasciolopsis buskii TaxID=27845 RepID=A0A8E0RX87_9TREM|nr:hypothetical protein FBUS_01796 [Fasciolopsis buski]